MAASTTRCSKSTSEGADAILRALAPIEWDLEHDGAGCPPERVPTTASLSAWLPECPADAWGAAADHAGGFHADKLANSIVILHRRWVALPEDKRGAHPLGPLVKAWQAARGDPPSAVVVKTRRGMVRRSKRLSSLVQAPWDIVPVDAAMVDGQPLAANLPDLPASLARRTVYKPQGKQLRLPGVAMPAWSADWRLIAVSSIAPASGAKSALANDMLRLAAVAHSVEGRLELDDMQGAALLARHQDGSPRRPLQSDVRRWHDATNWLRCALWVDPKTHKWFPLAEVTALHGSTVLAPPEWSRHPQRGKDGGWTLSTEGGVAARARFVASGDGSAAGRVVTALEHMLACGFDGDKVSQFLRPANGKAGGHGSTVPITWRETMTLAGIAWNWHDKAADERQRKRWGRIVARLRKAGYMVGSLAVEAAAGDSIEIVEVVRGSRAHPGGLRFRASARFVEAAILSDNQQFLRVSLGDWLGFTMPE